MTLNSPSSSLLISNTTKINHIHPFQDQNWIQAFADPSKVSFQQLIDLVLALESTFTTWSTHFTSVERSCCFEYKHNILGTEYDWKEISERNKCKISQVQAVFTHVFRFLNSSISSSCLSTLLLAEVEDESEHFLRNCLQSQQWLPMTLLIHFLSSSVPSLLNPFFQSHHQELISIILSCLETNLPFDGIRTVWLEILIKLSAYPDYQRFLESQGPLMAWLRMKALKNIPSLTFVEKEELVHIMATQISLKLGEPIESTTWIKNSSFFSISTSNSSSLETSVASIKFSWFLLETLVDTLTLFSFQPMGILQLSQVPLDQWKHFTKTHLLCTIQHSNIPPAFTSSVITLTYHLVCLPPSSSSTLSDVSEEVLELRHQCYEHLRDHLVQSQWFSVLSKLRMQKTDTLTHYLSNIAYHMALVRSRCALLIQQGILTWLLSLNSFKSYQALALLTIYLDPTIVFPGKTLDSILSKLLQLLNFKLSNDLTQKELEEGHIQAYMALTNLVPSLNLKTYFTLTPFLFKHLTHTNLELRQRVWECLGNLLCHAPPEMILPTNKLTWQVQAIQCLCNPDEPTGMKQAAATVLAMAFRLLTSEAWQQIHDILLKTHDVSIAHRLVYAIASAFSAISSSLSESKIDLNLLAQKISQKFKNNEELFELLQTILNK